jgi:excisionase family DNA binding protein
MLTCPIMQGKENSDFLTVDEAAQLVGLAHWTIRAWLHKGLLTRYKSASRTVVNRSELLALVEPKPQTEKEKTK